MGKFTARSLSSTTTTTITTTTIQAAIQARGISPREKGDLEGGATFAPHKKSRRGIKRTKRKERKEERKKERKKKKKKELAESG